MRRRPSRRTGALAIVGLACTVTVAVASGACGGLDEAPSAAARVVAGAACAAEGDRRACGVAIGDPGDPVACAFGEATCAGGAWSECAIEGPVTLAPRSAGYDLLGLGQAAPCGNDSSCDPNCFQFKDTGPGVGPNDAGVVEGDGGLTLKATDGGGPQIGQCKGGTTGTCSHSPCTVGAKLAAGCDGAAACVAKICAGNAHPECCTTEWKAECVAYIPQYCTVACAADTNGTCVLCWQDATDHDGDGWSYAQGDCRDCDATINPGSFDFAGNGIDEDCTGVADDATGCDGALAMASANPMDYAKAIGICQTTTAGATGAQKKWGVLESKLVQANNSSAPQSLSYGILTKLGPNNLPRQGTQMAVFSSGTARAPGDPSYVNPTSSYNQGTACAYPAGFPKNAANCPNGSGTANDSSGLFLKMRVPTNAKSFSYDFDFFSAEYPEWVCTAYNDGYVALLTSSYVPANPAKNSGNITFDSNGNPVSVNIGFFGVPGCPTCTSAKLTSTGFDGTCGGYTCGGATDWLQTSAPVVPGETITIQFSIWDTGDHVYDSTVLLDNWRWSPNPSQIVTQPPAAPQPPKYLPGTFVRDFQAVCPAATQLAWLYYIWTASTPGDSSIVLGAQTADTQPGLAGATKLALATAKNQNGTAFAPLAALPGGVSKSWLRVTADLQPTSDALGAPVLLSWTAQFDCVPTE